MLTPGQLTQLLESKDITFHHDFEHDEETLTKLTSALQGLGYRKSPSSKTRVLISHREVFDRKAKEILWVAKPKDPLGKKFSMVYSNSTNLAHPRPARDDSSAGQRITDMPSYNPQRLKYS